MYSSSLPSAQLAMVHLSAFVLGHEGQTTRHRVQQVRDVPIVLCNPYTLFGTLSATLFVDALCGGRYSLEEICTHCPLSPIALQTPYALVRGFLARVKVLAVRLTVAIVSVVDSRFEL
jgi:hypothetical protein